MAVSSSTLAMLLADARLPSGGHAHSAGVEPALRGGLDRADILAFLHTRAHTTSLVEAGTAVVALHVALMDEALDPVDKAWAARTPSGAMRDAARILGRGYLRLGLRLWPSAVLSELAEGKTPTRAVVLGAIAATAGMSPIDLVRLCIYDDAASAAAALLKLEPRDPAEVTAWILDVCSNVDHLLEPIADITEPAAIPAAAAPQAEEWAQSHALLSQRLFRA